MPDTVTITTVTETRYTVSKADAESIEAACEYWASNGSGEESEYGDHLDSPWDTLDHFFNPPTASTISIEGEGVVKTYEFKEETQ